MALGLPAFPAWFEARVQRTETCWLWHGQRINGYGRHHRQDIGGHVYMHRFVWMLVNGPIPDGLFVLHTCDVPRCVNPDHLFVGTLSDNMKDCAAKGRHCSQVPGFRRGERAGRALLTETQVREIRALKGQVTGVALAKRFHVSERAISSVLCGTTWKEVV